MSVLRSQKIHSKSYLSRSGCGKAFFFFFVFCICTSPLLLLGTTQAGSWRAREGDGLLPASSGLDRKIPFVFLIMESCLISTIRDASASTLQIPCWQSVRVRSSASVPHYHCLFFKPEEKSCLQSKEQVNKRLHLSPADTNVTAGNAGSDSRRIIARAGGARGVALVWQSHGARSQEVKSWRSFLSKFGNVSSSPPALLIRPVNLNHGIVWILLACSEAGNMWRSCSKPNRYTVLMVTTLLFFKKKYLSHG